MGRAPQEPRAESAMSHASNHHADHDVAPHFDQVNARFAADLLRVRMAELAGLASGSLLRAHPGMAGRYRPEPLAKWKEHFCGRLMDLAAAMSVASPGVFATQVAWAAAAFRARGVPLEDLATSLTVLRDTLRREAPDADAALIDACFGGAASVLAGADVTPPTCLSVETAHGRVAAEYLLAILEGDRRAASRVVMDAVVTGGVSIRDAYNHILLPVQREVGRMWHINELSVAEEHFATATTRSVMAQLCALAKAREPVGLTLIVAAAEGNTHDLGVRVVADFFELAGWRVIELGADVPAIDLVRAVVDYGADAVAISGAMPSQISTIEDSISILRRDLDPCPVIIVGGPAFGGCPESATRIGADGHAPSAEAAIDLAHALVAKRP